MPEHIQYKEDDLFNPETRHEHSDAPVTPLLWFIVIFIALSVVTYFLVLFLYKGLASAERKRMDPPETQVVRPVDASVPKNQPLLQPFPRAGADKQLVDPTAHTPATDMIAMRRKQDETLRTYGWVDQQRGVVHIPIEEAKKRFAATYVAPAAAPVAPAATATTTASPSEAAPPPSSGLQPPSPPKSGGRRVSIDELRRTFPTRDEHTPRAFSPPQRGEGGQRPDEGLPSWQTRSSVSYSQARSASASTSQKPAGGTP